MSFITGGMLYALPNDNRQYTREDLKRRGILITEPEPITIDTVKESPKEHATKPRTYTKPYQSNNRAAKIC